MLISGCQRFLMGNRRVAKSTASMSIKVKISVGKGVLLRLGNAVLLCLELPILVNW